MSVPSDLDSLGVFIVLSLHVPQGLETGGKSFNFLLRGLAKILFPSLDESDSEPEPEPEVSRVRFLLSDIFLSLFSTTNIQYFCLS